MIPIIEGYEPKNKRLIRLGRKARLQIVLNGAISRQMLSEIKDAVSCRNCKYYSSEGLVISRSVLSCRKIGVKTKKYMMMMNSMTKNGQFSVGLQIAYCVQFKERKD
jgi:hypothetical protein